MFILKTHFKFDLVVILVGLSFGLVFWFLVFSVCYRLLSSHLAANLFIESKFNLPEGYSFE